MRGKLITMSLVLLPLYGAPATAQEFSVSPSARATILKETNAYRRSKGMPAVTPSARANAVAQDYATYLSRNDKAGHNADGRSPRARLEGAGVQVCHVWENFHQSWTRPQPASTTAAMAKAMRFWKKSPGHEKGLRSPATEIGVGVAGWRHGDRWIYSTIQMFVAPSCN